MLGYDASYAELKEALAKVQTLLLRRETELCALRDRITSISLLIDKDRLYQAHIEALINDHRERYHRELAVPKRVKATPRCAGSCQKMRFDSRDAASKFCAKRKGPRMRSYWDSACKCWHTTTLRGGR